MRRSNTHLIWIPEGEERENGPKLMTDINLQIKEAKWIPVLLSELILHFSFLQLVTESWTALTKLFRPQHFLNWMSRIRWQYPHYKGQKPGSQQKNVLSYFKKKKMDKRYPGILFTVFVAFCKTETSSTYKIF